MKDAVLLSFTPDANMRAVGEAADAAGCALMLCGSGETPSRGSLPRDRPLVLLAVGPECGATLAAWVAVNGLEGVVGVGLVGVTAPWAEREECRCEGKALFGPCPHDRIPLGFIEPLRGVAELARVGEMTITDGSGSWPDGTPHEGGTAYRRAYRLRVVVACAPDDGVCVCGGTRDPAYERAHGACGLCSGTGKALSSKAVAEELVGDPIEIGTERGGYEDGGLRVNVYSSSAALTEHGLRDVVERLTR